MGDLNELKHLSPEERMTKLKEIEERSRKEIEAAQKLMSESLREIEIEEEIRKDMPIPQLQAVDVGSLFSQEEKDLFKTKRFVNKNEEHAQKKEESALEEVIQKEKIHKTEGTQKQYGKTLDELDKDPTNVYKGMGSGNDNDPMKEAYHQQDHGPNDSYHKGGSDELRKMASIGEQISSQYKN